MVINLYTVLPLHVLVYLGQVYYRRVLMCHASPVPPFGALIVAIDVTVQFEKERLSGVQAAVVLLKEHVLRSGVKIIILLADSTKMPEMMFILIAKCRVHLVVAVRTTKRMAIAAFACKTVYIYYLIRIIQ